MNKILRNSLILMLSGSALSLNVAMAADQVSDANASTVRTARTAEDKEQLERRLASVATLLEKSSAAKQIEVSANPEALALRGKARDLRKQADTAYQAGDYTNASRMLDQAAKLMFEGVRLAAPEQITGEKKQRDFDNRMDSVKALLAAQKRISVEKNLGAKGIAISNKIEAQMREAAALATAGKLDDGRTLLDAVYVNAKAEVEKMRSGDTLVRSLNFATKEEEYHYEIDRNDTHKMLVRVLLDEKRASNPGLESMVKKYLDQADVLRQSAEGMGAKKDFESGIKLLEDSTKELVRAIRGAGIYIPG